LFGQEKGIREMKIVAINGSPRGRASNTEVMVDAFLKGARDEGAETVKLFLSEKDIRYCRGCHTCWVDSPGRCVIEDDMVEVLSELAGADVIALASPVYFNNISGTLKVFMDRLTVTGNPHSKRDDKKDAQDGSRAGGTAPGLMIISNCGFPDRSQFEVISLWIKRVAMMMQTDLICEIYATQGRLLCDPPEGLAPAVADYLRALEKAGSEIATRKRLSGETEHILGEDYIQKQA
jgi:multimeric flavodoxin WrbA